MTNRSWILPKDEDIKVWRRTIDDGVQAGMAMLAQRNERCLRFLLERWVSGLDPAAAIDHRGFVFGLCAEEHSEIGTRPFILKLSSLAGWREDA